jgi:hypothetical protein
MDPYTQNPTSQKIGKYGAHPHVSISIRVHNPVERLASATPGLLTLTAAGGKDFFRVNFLFKKQFFGG